MTVIARESSVAVVEKNEKFPCFIVFTIIPVAHEGSIKMHATNCKINRAEQTEVNVMWLNIVRTVKNRDKDLLQENHTQIHRDKRSNVIICNEGHKKKGTSVTLRAQVSK